MKIEATLKSVGVGLETDTLRTPTERGGIRDAVKWVNEQCSAEKQKGNKRDQSGRDAFRQDKFLEDSLKTEQEQKASLNFDAMDAAARKLFDDFTREQRKDEVDESVVL